MQQQSKCIRDSANAGLNQDRFFSLDGASLKILLYKSWILHKGCEFWLLYLCHVVGLGRREENLLLNNCVVAADLVPFKYLLHVHGPGYVSIHDQVCNPEKAAVIGETLPMGSTAKCKRLLLTAVIHCPCTVVTMSLTKFSPC